MIQGSREDRSAFSVALSTFQRRIGAVSGFRHCLGFRGWGTETGVAEAVYREFGIQEVALAIRDLSFGFRFIVFTREPPK